MDELNLKKMTYYDIPLSVIYKQFIRFMKENGIYAPYLEISLPKTNMSYETFLINVFKSGDSIFLDNFFCYVENIGVDWYKYAEYSDTSANSFFKKINDKWAAYLFNLIEIDCKKNYGRTES